MRQSSSQQVEEIPIMAMRAPQLHNIQIAHMEVIIKSRMAEKKQQQKTLSL